MGMFRTGIDAAKEASTKGGPAFAKTHYFQLEDGGETIIRFLTDADKWVTVDQHQYVFTKPQPSDWQGNWPQSMSAVCRRTKLGDGSTLFNDCYICSHMTRPDGAPHKASSRTWALAVLREEVKGDNGAIIGYRDQMREVAEVSDGKPTGKTRMEKAVIIINMGYRNFFGALQGFAGRYGTVLDRDYYIRREGGGLDTQYHVVPLDPIESPDPDDNAKVVRFDLRDERFMAAYKQDMPDLEDTILSRASDEFYQRWFAPSGDSAPTTNGNSNGSHAAASNDISDAKVAELAARIKGYSTSPV